MSNKIAGAYVDLVKVLNRLEAMGEMPLCDGPLLLVGLSGEVSRDLESGEWRVAVEHA